MCVLVFCFLVSVRICLDGGPPQIEWMVCDCIVVWTLVIISKHTFQCSRLYYLLSLLRKTAGFLPMVCYFLFEAISASFVPTDFRISVCVAGFPGHSNIHQHHRPSTHRRQYADLRHVALSCSREGTRMFPLYPGAGWSVLFPQSIPGMARSISFVAWTVSFFLQKNMFLSSWNLPLFREPQA